MKGYAAGEERATHPNRHELDGWPGKTHEKRLERCETEAVDDYGAKGDHTGDTDEERPEEDEVEADVEKRLADLAHIDV